ncbi:MAG: nucleotidyl transferase AbiEii/AbiGii toxin family protein [Nitrospirota bacterium]
MKPILGTLKELKNLINNFIADTEYKDTAIALVGGYAVIAHGVERTTKDIDILSIGSPYDSFGKDLTEFLRRQLSTKGIKVEYLPQSHDIHDPFQHEVIYLKDPEGATPRIDIIIASYKWEVEGLLSANPEKEIPINILPKPYLIAMKLKAGGPKDDYDIIELYELLTDEEKIKTNELARIVHKDKKLARLIKPRKLKREKEDKDQLIKKKGGKR